MFAAKREATAYDHFQDQMICAARHPDADPKVELPLRRDIEIDGGKDLMLLFTLWIKTAQRSERSVILKAAIDRLRDRVGDFEIRRELKATLSARSIESALDGRVEREIPALYFLVDDGANFPAPGICRELAAHITDLLRETDTHGPMPFRRHAKARSNMCADKIPAAAMARAGEYVESRFKPIVKAVGDFDRLVPGMIRR